MSGISINLKLQKAYNKIGKKIGFDFLIYRSIDYINPIQPRNLYSTVSVAYALDDKFMKQQEYGFSLYNLYLDTSNFKPGDIFVRDDITLTLVADKAIAIPKAIMSTNKISIFRPKYSTVGGFKPLREEIHSKVPAQILSTNSGQTSGNSANLSQNKAPLQEWDIWTWLPVGSIQPNDSITDEMGNDMIIKSISLSDLGYRLHCVSTKS